jgi:hypothetical protein
MIRQKQSQPERVIDLTGPVSVFDKYFGDYVILEK